MWTLKYVVFICFSENNQNLSKSFFLMFDDTKEETRSRQLKKERPCSGQKKERPCSGQKIKDK